MSKNYISHDEYLRIKERSVKKSYALRFKKLRLLAIVFSYFGHMASIFFAYFFFIKLFLGTAFAVNTIGLTIGIITFLILFEWVKRYTFDLFSLEYIKTSMKGIQKSMAGFIVITMTIISLSFFFSLKGARDIINNSDMIENLTQVDLTTKNDSINNYYFTQYIKPLKEENNQNLQQKSTLADQQSQLVTKGWSTTKIDDQIKEIDNQINKNKEDIKRYESQRDNKLSELKQQIENKSNQAQNKNQLGIIYFLCISFIIEFLIIIGVFYNRMYDAKVCEEFESDVMREPKYRRWLQIDSLMDLIFHKEIQINDVLPSTAEFLEISKINEMNITEKDLEGCFKILSHLKIYERSGKNRTLKVDEKTARILLKEHFKVDQK